MDDTDLSLGDWMDLFVLRTPMDDLMEGFASPAEIHLAIDQRRDVYPGVLGDYIRVLEAMHDYVRAVEQTISDQNSRLSQFADAVAEAGVVFTWDQSRLLTLNKRAEINGIEAYLEKLAARAEQAAEEAAEGLEEIQEAIDDLEDQRDALEGRAEELEAQIAELEEQLAAAEDGD